MPRSFAPVLLSRVTRLFIALNLVLGASGLPSGAFASAAPTISVIEQHRIGETSQSERWIDRSGEIVNTGHRLPVATVQNALQSPAVTPGITVTPPVLSRADESKPSSAASSTTPTSPDTLSLAFVPNRGQSDPAVRFQVTGQGGSVFFKPDEIVLVL
ncbi:MAG: hypothetical protein KA764_20545, partial [Anaerolineales bacterium]|nr:hypothetical protein [Anaerolineales bacterium]